METVHRQSDPLGLIDIDWTTLYNNHLKQYNTKWFNIKQRPTRGNDNVVGTSVAVLHVWDAQLKKKSLYRFSLYMARAKALDSGSGHEAYTYDFYPGTTQPQQKQQKLVVHDRAQRSATIPPLPQNLSALYIVALARHLAQYKEPIEVYALPNLDGVMHRRLISNNGGGDNSDNDIVRQQRAPISPALLYHNLVMRSNNGSNAVVIMAPDQYGARLDLSGEPPTKYILRPVYGPAHQPLNIIISRAQRPDENYRVFFGPHEMATQKGIDIVVPLGERSRLNCAYDVMALIESLGRWIEGDDSNERSLREWLQSYKRPSEDELSVLESKSVATVVPPDILLAIKVARLYAPLADSLTQVNKAKQLYRYVYEEYKNSGRTGAPTTPRGGGLSGKDDAWLQQQVVATLRRLLQDLASISIAL